MLVQDTDIRFTLRLLKCCPGFLILLGFILSPTAWSATDCTQVTQIPQLECEALLDLYNNTDGPNWLNKNGWNKTNTPCDGWYGVSCVSGHVVTLSLSNNKLNGTIPELLGNLSQLGILDLDSDQLSGHIPESLGNLSQLGFLSLGNNQQLSGPIPESLGNLSQLESLRLYDSQLSGPIPESLGNLSQLNSLILFNNQLSGPIPESLGNLNQLGQLYLSGNQLCGEIPNTLISLGNMFECDLTSNYLTVNPNSSILITFLNQKCPDWMTQNPPPTKCPPDKPYTLTLQTTGDGTVTAPVGLDDGIQCPDNCSEDYLENSNLTLTAQAADNFIFTQWIGDCTGTDPLLTVTITNNFTCTATFEPKPPQVETHQFSIAPAGDGQGTINLQINHAPAVNCQPDCTQTLPHQSEITLTAQAADEHSVFVGWFGNGCTSHFFLTQDITCTARFEPRPQYTLTVVPQGLGHGYVSSDGGQIACGDQCSHTYLSGTAVTLTATPDSGSSFLGWSGDCQSSTQLATVEVNRQLTCMPSFGTVVTPGPVGTPQLRVDPATGITFSPTQTRAKRTVTLSNPGNGSLILETLTIADITAFQISKDTCSNQRLIPNGTCTVTLVFAPPTTASYQTQLLIPSNAPNTLTAVDLQGSGCSDPTDFHSNVVFQPSRLDFGTEPVGHSTTRQQRIDLWSEGCGSVDIDTIKLSGRHADEFAIEKQDCYYGTWQNDNYTSCTLIAAFNPTSAGIKEVQPVITYTDPTLQTSPYRWNAQAVSEGAAQLQLSETQHDFGTLTLGHEPPPPWLLTLTNYRECQSRI